MSSICYNLKRKMEWMGRRLRKIDKAEDIKQWVSAMREINGLLKEVEINEYRDTWRPWSKRVQRGKDEGTIDQRASTRPNLKSEKMETVPQVGLEESSGSELMNNDDLKMLPVEVRSRPPRVEVEGDDIEMLDPKAAVMKMLRDAKDQQWKTMPQGERGLAEAKNVVEKELALSLGNENPKKKIIAKKEIGKRLKEYNLLERGKRKLVKGMRMKPTTSLESAAKERRTLRMSVPAEAIVIGKNWRTQLHQRLNDDGYKGCVYQGKHRAWHPTEELLNDIATEINRDGENDLSNTILRKVLVSDTIKFFENKETEVNT